MSRRSRCLVVLATAGLAWSAVPASAYVPAPLTKRAPHRFVVLGSRDGKPVLRLTADTKRRYAGHEIEWRCTGVEADHSGGGREPIVAIADPLDVERDDDYCQVQVVVSSVKTYRDSLHDLHRVRVTRHLRQTIAITAAGRTYVTRVRAASAVGFAIWLSPGAFDDKTKTFSNVVEYAGAAGLLVLPTADTPAPVGRTGIWGEGSRFRATRGLADGTQVFYDYDQGTRVVTSNILPALSALDARDSWWNDSVSSRALRAGSHG